jgi:hypothetical protein
MNNLIDGNYVDLSFLFKNEDDGSEVLIKHPYFDNLDAHLRKKDQVVEKLMDMSPSELNKLIALLKEEISPISQ